jgi:major membrane immunogen (membrane-anchored lipoprotein)
MKNTIRTGLLAVVAVAAALLLVACGGDDSTTSDSTSSDSELSNEEYSAEVQDVTSSFAGGFDELSQQAANPTSPEDFRDAVVGIQDRITQTVDELEAITPPADVADLHDQLIAVFADYRDGYDPIVEALDAEDQQALQEAATEIPNIVEDFQTTYQDLQSQFADADITIEATGTESTTTTP